MRIAIIKAQSVEKPMSTAPELKETERFKNESDNLPSKKLKRHLIVFRFGLGEPSPFFECNHISKQSKKIKNSRIVKRIKKL